MSDPINRPAHYTYSAIEPIDAIEAWQLGFNLGNTVKYVARSSHKGATLEDLKKARWYLDREITLLEAGSTRPVERPVLVEGTLDPKASIEDHIRHFLSKDPQQSFHVTEIAEGSGLNKRKLGTCLSRLVRRRVITRVRRGFYQRAR